MSFGWLFLGECSLIVVAFVWSGLRGISIPFRIDLAATGVALAATLGFVVVNFSLYHLSKRAGRPAGVLAFLESELFSLFRGMSVWQLTLLAAAAGLGEELLFRGVIQEELGLGVASVLFGLMHGPTEDLWPLALWAAVTGAALGALYQVSGNLFVPAVSHALYDSAALIYFGRRGGNPRAR
ncbi:MAG: lysostaphin resistance A-like protein [Vicinamibacteria bacterium]